MILSFVIPPHLPLPLQRRAPACIPAIVVSRQSRRCRSRQVRATLGAAKRRAPVRTCNLKLFLHEGVTSMAYTLPPLPYPINALEPHIDAKTMEIHHTKHHQAYINNVNAALEAHPALASQSVE